MRRGGGVPPAPPPPACRIRRRTAGRASPGVPGVLCALCAPGVSDIPDVHGIPVGRYVLPRGAARPGGYGLRGGRLRRQEEQAPRKEPCRPPYDMSHSLQSRYFDRTSYEFLRECKALIRKNTPRVFCFVGSGFSVPLRPAGFALPGFFPACFGILARAVAGYRGTLPVVTRNRHFAREAGITRTEVLPPPE